MSSTCFGLFEYAGVEFDPLVLMVIVNTLLALSNICFRQVAFGNI